VNVSATDKSTGKTQNIIIQTSGGLSKDQIQKMVKDAEAMKAEDEKRKEQIEALNEADQLIYTTEKSLNENKSKLSEEVVREVESALQDTRKAIADKDNDLKSQVEKLRAAAMKIGQ